MLRFRVLPFWLPNDRSSLITVICSDEYCIKRKMCQISLTPIFKILENITVPCETYCSVLENNTGLRIKPSTMKIAGLIWGTVSLSHAFWGSVQTYSNLARRFLKRFLNMPMPTTKNGVRPLCGTIWRVYPQNYQQHCAEWLKLAWIDVEVKQGNNVKCFDYTQPCNVNSFLSLRAGCINAKFELLATKQFRR